MSNQRPSPFADGIHFHDCPDCGHSRACVNPACAPEAPSPGVAVCPYCL